MPENSPQVKSENVIMTNAVFKNEYKFVYEAVFVQQYLCTPVNFPLHIRVLFCGIFIDSIIIMDFAEHSLR